MVSSSDSGALLRLGLLAIGRITASALDLLVDLDLDEPFFVDCLRAFRPVPPPPPVCIRACCSHFVVFAGFQFRLIWMVLG